MAPSRGQAASEYAGNKAPFRLKTADSLEIKVPSIPEAESLAAASDRAFVVLPATCASSCGLLSNFGADSDGARHWLGRVENLSE
ncbi:unnamed protein product, partial [Polarella glacialis]